MESSNFLSETKSNIVIIKVSFSGQVLENWTDFRQNDERQWTQSLLQVGHPQEQSTKP